MKLTVKQLRKLIRESLLREAARSDEAIFRNLVFCRVGEGYRVEAWDPSTRSDVEITMRCIENTIPNELYDEYETYLDSTTDFQSDFWTWLGKTHPDQDPAEFNEPLYRVTIPEPEKGSRASYDEDLEASEVRDLLENYQEKALYPL